MQLRNNYEKNVFNGDIGRVLSVDTEEGGLIADFDGERIPYAEEELDQINLAYAATIHKSQGKTFDNALVDLGKGAFATGQTYVALSRCRTIDGLAFTRPLRLSDIRTDPVLVEFHERMRRI